MRFVVLGGLHVEDDAGQPAAPRSLRQRHLLALLVCRRGRAVTSDDLVELLWNGQPPASARQNVRTYVHRLRGGIGDGRIAFESDGYTLRLYDDELDAAVFESLAGGGHAALAGGDAETAYARLGEALAVWNGEPFADLTSGAMECPDPVRLEAGRLMERWMVAREDFIDAALTLGHTSDLVPELTVWLNEHPFRERLRTALMRALYRSGRAAEALEVYRVGRALTVEELGIEPGPELRDMEHAILTDDPDLAAPAVVGAPSRDAGAPSRKVGVADSPQPTELPAVPPGFTGRVVEERRLTRRLRVSGRTDAGACVVTISGRGGVGKSALAVHAATTVAEDFPDGRLYADLGGATFGQEPLSAGHVLARFLGALGLDDANVPADIDEAAGRFRSLTADRRLLIVLDDAADAAQVRPLLPGGGNCAALITSRTALTGLASGVEDLRLDTLSMPDAVAVLAGVAGADRVAADPEAVARIAQLCDRLPLALRIAGERLAARPDWTPADLAARLVDSRTRLDELVHHDQAMVASCQVSHRALPEPAAHLFEMIGRLDVGDITAPVAAALTNRSEGEARRDLDRLVDAHLLQARGDRHTLRGLTRLYARDHARRHPSATEPAVTP